MAVGKVHRDVAHLHRGARDLRAKLEGQTLIRLDADDERVLSRLAEGRVAEGHVGGALKDDGDLGDALAEALASAQVEGHARPAASVHVELDSGEGFGGRVDGDAIFLEVSAYLVSALPATRVLAARRARRQVFR